MVYAGIAYEIQILQGDGRAAPVDPTGYRFHTGDRFQVALRPSLPGLVDVYNIDPRGVTKKIDSQTIPGGQLMRLGTYRFVRETGEEKLRIVISPCSTPTLLAATRSIVRYEESDPPVRASAPRAARTASLTMRPIALQSCGALEPIHGVTRGIEKVESEEGTAFALDPVSPDETLTGRYASREVTIVMHHD